MSGSYPPPTYRPPRRSLPIGVGILAVLIGLFAILLVVAGLLIVIASSIYIAVTPSTLFGLTGAAAGLVILILGLVILAVALGLWHLEMWALVLCILVIGIFLAADVYASSYDFGTVIDVILIVYLLAVSGHFD